jgi:hypothetical protein
MTLACVIQKGAIHSEERFPRAVAMAAEIPVVRLFAACEEILTQPDSPNVSLRNVFHRIVRLPGEPFPCVCEQMALFALLANGRGEHALRIDLTRVDQGAEALVFQSPSRPVNLGQDPMAVHGLPVPRMRVVFGHAGQYTFSLICDGQRIAGYHVEVR